MQCDVAAIRKQAWHFLTPEVAARAGLTLQGLQQFAAGTVTLTDEQLRDLARRMGIPEACSYD